MNQSNQSFKSQKTIVFLSKINQTKIALTTIS